ncbi:GEMI4 protein, partial [Leiothrix lutea]|nr:GEMI4 protein [Leiothrix lutea]
PWAVGEETAILHGGFLLAARLLQPRPLRELRKADWPRAGVPITDALREIGERCPSPLGLWKKEAVAIVWAKILLPAPPAAALEWGWKDDGFFSVGAMIPDVNHTALFELVKALGAPRLFVQLLLALPPDVCRGQLEDLVEYISSETSPSDVRFFLDVWWEVMKHREGEEDATVSAFSALIRQHGAESALEDGLQPPKRFKGDPGNAPAAPGLPQVLLEGGSEELCLESYRLLEALTTLGKDLDSLLENGDLGEGETRVVLELTQLTRDFLRDTSAVLKGLDTSLVSSVAMAIIAQRLDRHVDTCSVFASEKTWAFSKAWVECLVENKALFQTPELVLELLQTLVSFATSHQDKEARELQGQVTEAVVECYTELSLSDKNQVISGVLASWGGPGLSQNVQAVREGFQEDLNVTLNQITKSVSDEGLSRAVASMARLALLSPQATVKQVCHLAVVNLGAHQFLAQILCSFPALNFLESQEGPGRPRSLVVRCLEEAVWGKLSTAREEEQFLQFLAFLMQPGSATPLVSPAEVTKTFVLPYLKSDSPEIELSLQILSKVLGVPSCSEEHWIKSCHPFPLLLSLCRLLDGYTKYWHQPEEQLFPSLETKDL